MLSQLALKEIHPMRPSSEGLRMFDDYNIVVIITNSTDPSWQ